MATTQVAVRLDDDLLKTLDELVASGDDLTRADIMRTALTDLAKRERHRRIDEQIRLAYERQPVKESERSWSLGSSWDTLDDDDWSDV